MFFDFDNKSTAEAAEDIEHMVIECRRQVGTGKNYTNERAGIFRTEWTRSYRPLATQFEHKETHAVNNELSREMMEKVYETFLRRFETHHDHDITYEGETADGAIWQFKLLNGHQSVFWQPIKTIKERNGFFF